MHQQSRNVGQILTLEVSLSRSYLICSKSDQRKWEMVNAAGMEGIKVHNGIGQGGEGIKSGYLRCFQGVRLPGIISGGTIRTDSLTNESRRS